LKVIDLFCGIGGWSAAFKDRGHQVLTLDNEKSFKPDMCMNILDAKRGMFPFQPDIVLASPPCEAFSRLRYKHNWQLKADDPRKPISVKAKLGIMLLQKTLDLINDLNPRFYIIENPVGRMRYMYCLSLLERRTVTYCKYGHKAQKPTDLWGMFPPSLVLREVCKVGDPCHQSAKGTAKGAVVAEHCRAERAKVPYDLSLAVCLAAERDLSL